MEKAWLINVFIKKSIKNDSYLSVCKKTQYAFCNSIKVIKFIRRFVTEKKDLAKV